MRDNFGRAYEEIDEELDKPYLTIQPGRTPRGEREETSPPLPSAH